MASIVKKFFVYILEWLDVNNSGNGITILVDCRDTGLANQALTAICASRQTLKIKKT
jgi:hypothetical protein